MDFYKKFKKLSNESLYIMIVPHSGESIRQIKFKKLILYSFATIFTVLSISFVLLISSNLYLNHQLDKKTKDLSNLSQLNTEQAVEIDKLKNKTHLVSEKLTILNELEIQVRNLVGLKNTNNSSSSKPISRSTIRSKSPIEPVNTYESDEPMDEELKILSSEMDKEVENLNSLIQDVTKQLKFLDAKPNKYPAQGKITSKFGYRISPIDHTKQFHKGLDIANKQGTKIVAAGTGVVTFSGWNSGYGKTIIISHGYGYRSVYAHNKENLVEVGQKVHKGDVIAKMGSTGRSTGPHVHFEIHYNGEQIDPQKVLSLK